jgi:AraC-like DNA-binding protein
MDPTYTAALQRGYLLSLFSIILSNISLGSASPQESGALRTVIAYCSMHYADDLSLSALERELHISKYYISHLFTEKLKMRFNDYIHSIRIHEACKLLRKDHVSITDIVGLVGFNSLRTFNRTFTNQFGISPSEFRKKYQEQSESDRLAPTNHANKQT